MEAAMREMHNEMILASAGSGKTYQLSNRIAGLVMRGVEPRRIAALTFTRKAAGEFADAVVEKLAKAARDEQAAAALAAQLGVQCGRAEFQDRLDVVVRELPRVFLGTMDSFFARVVRGFQYELGVTGGTFELVQGAALQAAQDEVMGGILGEGLHGPTGEQFLESFKRATFGREEQKVSDLLRQFVKNWHARFMELPDPEVWGGQAVIQDCGVDDWDHLKGDLLGDLVKGMASVEWTDKRQEPAAEAMLEAMDDFVPVDGIDPFKSGMGGAVMKAWDALESGEGGVKFQKEFTLPRVACEALVKVVRSMARAVFEGHLMRTRAVREVMAAYEGVYARELRERGRLAFDDVKRLMGAWAGDEEARLRREWVDFRLDGRYDHWLLDEFQDTSRTDWMGVAPLVGEAAMDPEGQRSVFVVGDRKQGIFAWRGGDVGLFDEVVRTYGIEPKSMPVSERSGPEVLALVNAVCGDRSVMERLFPDEAVGAWDFETHVPSVRVADKHGYSEVREVEGKFEDRCESLAELLGEIDPGGRGLSCGVLVRENKAVVAVADDLRLRGFEVVEEGKRRPAGDNTFGVALLDVFRWLANPEDCFAREHVWMSPLGPVMNAWLGESLPRCWEAAHDFGSSHGWAKFVAELAARVGELSDFGQRRVLELVRGLEEAQGLDDRSAAAIERFLEGWEVEQTAGAGAIQVMTIHKSKGLGFDVVIVPELSDGKIPDLSRLNVLEKSGSGPDQGKLRWISQAPPSWVQQALPPVREAVDEWRIGQSYESMCLLYVALTRAKVAQYVFLPEPAKTVDHNKPSLANWVRQCCGEPDEDGVMATWGDRAWFEQIAVTPRDQGSREPGLPAPGKRRERRTPSGAKGSLAGAVSGGGMKVGLDVHALFERIGWLKPGEVLKQPLSQAGKMVEDALRDADLHKLFEKPDGPVDLFREQALEVILDGKWLSGVVDRMHVFRNEDGGVVRVEVLDFKTDRVENADELRARYSGQMEAYREALATVFSADAECIRCLLVSTHLKQLVELEDA
jgi:ATP-dependent helicase/nuclease subunit A